MSEPIVFLKLPEVLSRVKLSKPQVYKLAKKDQFPRPRKINRSSRWVEAEITAWQQARMAA